MKSLLQRAKEVESREVAAKKQFSKEEIEVALAWLNSEITSHQLAKVLGMYKSNTYPFVLFRLRAAIKKGLLVIK